MHLTGHSAEREESRGGREGGGYSTAGGCDLNEDEGDGTERKRRRGKGAGGPADGVCRVCKETADQGGLG